MRHILAIALIFIAGTACAQKKAAPKAQGLSARDLLVREAARDVEIERLKLMLYERISFPTRIRKLEGDIKLAEAEVASFKRRVAEYRQFTKFKYSNPLFISRENAKLQLLEAQIRLKNLKEEKVLLCRFKTTSLRLKELELDRARDRLRRLIGDGAKVRRQPKVKRRRSRAFVATKK